MSNVLSVKTGDEAAGAGHVLAVLVAELIEHKLLLFRITEPAIKPTRKITSKMVSILGIVTSLFERLL
ncbi:MAG: hypothetical protein A2Z25_00270 [Planctomycetes bacterium RBG_16_55_9]|nr:MAG: hypothetical protein A2Z25_00270 [Planctomycetes bacterium RBG_16_55_9]